MRILLLTAILVLAGCSSQPVQMSTYLLRPQAAASGEELVPEGDFALDGVLVASYLNQPGLVLATGDGKIHVASHHQWAEPLEISLRQYLSAEISASAGKQVEPRARPGIDTRINILVNRLHGDGKGGAVIEAFWELVSKDSDRSYRFYRTQALSGDGYDALVQAEEALLRQLAAAIGASLG